MEPRFHTTQLQAGLGLIAETRALLDLYESGLNVSALTERALASGRFPLISARRLLNIVSECFAPRYLRSAGTAAALKKLAPAMTNAEFNQLLLIHTARANAVLADFLAEEYWPRYVAGHDSISIDDARRFVTNSVREGRSQTPWSETTIKRVASYLLSCCADYDLLSNNTRGPRGIKPLRLSPGAAVYLAYDLRFQGLGDNQILNHADWKIFGLDAQDVREQLKAMSLAGHLIFQAAGEVIHIGWTYKTMDELTDVLTRL